MIFFLLKIIAFKIGRLPLSLIVPAGKFLGRLAYFLDKKHRDIACENISKAYGEDLTAGQVKGTAREVFENLGITLLEFMRIPWLKRGGLTGYVECEGLKNLDRALAKKKGVILFTAHMGNWELMAAWYALMGYPLDVVIRELDNPVFERFVSWVRTRPGNSMVSKGRAMRRLLRSLSNNGIAGILLDQNVAENEGVFVDFFGRPACTNKGPAMIAAVSGAAVLPTFIIRKGKTHRIIVGPEVALVNTGDKEGDALENTARCTKAIEDMIRKHPGQWFWVHRRWKTRPE